MVPATWQRDMAFTEVQSFDRAVHTTNGWIRALLEEMGWDEHQLGAQLPLLARATATPGPR